VRDATGFSCAVVRPADEKSCAIDARAVGGASVSKLVTPSPKRLGLDAQRRLRRKAQFERLLRAGQRRNVAGYTFYFARRAAGQPRLGILISRKHAAASVDRNRIKRCIREAFRLEQERLGPVDLLVRPPYGLRTRADIVPQLRDLLCRLNA
jgi:ribonuclease P protein component